MTTWKIKVFGGKWPTAVKLWQLYHGLPTCFCSDVEEVTDLEGKNAERLRHWDSCFNNTHSYVVGGSVRQQTQSRYRQWLTHKLASWQDQFDTLGCTGCGRCITWCPVGIDLTEITRGLNMAVDLYTQLSSQPFLQGMDDDSIHLIADCAELKTFNANDY